MELGKIRTNTSQAILQFSIPAIIAMLLTAMITIADGYFTGNYVGKEGIAAINLGLPIVYLYLGLGLMMSVGGSALASMALGAGGKEKGNAIFNQTIVTTVFVSFMVSFIALLAFRPILSVLRVNQTVADYFLGYYTIMLVELPVLIMNNALGMFIRGEGNPQFFMKNSLLNVLANIILDYVFAGRLHMGIEGIAMASLISSLLCLGFLLRYFFSKSKGYKFQKFAFDKEIMKSTICNGFSEFIGEISMSITMFAYNLVIMKNIGVDGVTAFTIVGYISYIFSMIILGFGQGISPLVSFSYGAKEAELAKKIRTRTNAYVTGAGIIVIFMMLILSDWYSSVFVKSEIIAGMIQTGIQIFMISFLFSGLNTITSFYFTSIGKAKESAVISALRGLIILLICIVTLPVIFSMTGVWMVAPVTEILTIPISIYFLIKSDCTIKNIENHVRAERRLTSDTSR